jgi:hypothetical protein
LPVIASTAVTTGVFVLVGVVVGGLVSGGVNYALEWRRERATARIAMRLLEVELAIAGVSADWILEDGIWTSWHFERAHRAWDQYRADAAGVLSADDWVKVSVGFYGVDVVERGFGKLPPATRLDPSALALLAETRRSLYEGANTLRRRLGMDEIRPGA